MHRERLSIDEQLAYGWPVWCYWPRSPFEKYATEFSRRNQWRVEATLGSLRDCIQECAYRWVFCRNRYANSVNNPAWFMALYKATIVNAFHTYGKKDHYLRTIGLEPPDVSIEYSAGPALVALEQASVELHAVLALLADAPAEVLEMLLDGRSEVVHSRRLLRFAGQSTNRNVLAELRSLLTPDTFKSFEQRYEARRDAERTRGESKEIRAKSQALRDKLLAQRGGAIPEPAPTGPSVRRRERLDQDFC